MATIIKTKEDIKRFVSTAFNFTFTNIEPYVKRAEREFIISVLGQDLYDAWAAAAPVAETTAKVYALIQEASANLSVFLYIPVGSVNITDAGILIVSNQTSKQAEWWQIRDLQRSLAALGFSAIDEALKLMEENEELFTAWNATEAYTVFKELLVPKTQDFQRHFNISSSRRTFLSLRPFQLETQNQIFNWLDATTFAQIKDASSAVELTALDYARAAQINHTVSKAASSGLFSFTAAGLFLKSLELPGEKAQPIDQVQLNSFIQKREQTAAEWLKKLKAFIIDNAAVFTSYTENIADPTVFYYNTKSIITF